jgi:Tfp pilus assembly protein PilN
MTYSSTMSIGRSRFASRGQNAVSFRDNDKRLGPISNAIILLVLLCLIGLVYLTQVTKTNAYSYQITELQTKQSQLKEEQKDLELTAARLKTTETASSATSGLVSVAPSGSITSN